MCRIYINVSYLYSNFMLYANGCGYRDIGGVRNAKDCGAATRGIMVGTAIA